MKPAYHISLSAVEKRLIAELSAVQTQSEWLMRLTIQHLLDVTPFTAQRIMGSTNIESNVMIWISVVRENHPDEAVKEWAEYAVSRMRSAAQSRNDFLHTLYGLATDGELQGNTSFIYGHRATKRHMDLDRRAIRVRTSTEAPLKDLRKLTDQAAFLTLVFAHVEESVNPTSNGKAPWLDRLGSKRPPQAKPLKAPKATTRRSPPQS